jgi:hypothetical protein
LLQELCARERDIFIELLNMGVDENTPGLNELHRLVCETRFNSIALCMQGCTTPAALKLDV